MIDETWREEARCAGEDTELFFPPRDKAKYKTIAAEARAFCFGGEDAAPCPVRLQCLWYAVETDEVHGIWGGMSHRERNALVRKWRKSFQDKFTLQEYILQLKDGNNGRN